jgi:hypothetical protein
MKWMRKAKALALIMVILQGCGTSPKLQGYPSSKLDRPFTLPEGMSEAHVNLPMGYFKETGFYDLQQPLPLYAYWTHAVSDRFSFIWFFLPLGFRYTLQESSQNKMGIEFFNHLGPPETPYLSPYLVWTDRYRLSQDWELEFRLGFQSVFEFKQGRVDLSSMWNIGPNWQILPWMCVRPWAVVMWNNNPEVSRLSLTPGVSAYFNLTQHWDVNLSGQGTLAGSRPGGRTGLLGSLEFIYYW